MPRKGFIGLPTRPSQARLPTRPLLLELLCDGAIFRNNAAEAGLPEVTPHPLRRTAATWLMMRGTDLLDPAQFLGMTAEQLERTYAHHRPDHLHGARKALDWRPGGVTVRSGHGQRETSACPYDDRDTESPPTLLEPLEREKTIRFRDESSGLSNTLAREPDKLAYFKSVLSSPDHTLSRKIRVTVVGKDVKGRIIDRSLPVTGGSAIGLSATDAWGKAAVGDAR